MTKEKKEEILSKISELLDELVDVDVKPAVDISKPTEMLTIKECSELIKGLSEHTVRKLVARGEIASIRTGEGKSGKILVPKASLLKYLDKLEAMI